MILRPRPACHHSRAWLRLKLAKHKWIEGPCIRLCCVSTLGIAVIQLLRIEAEVLQINTLNEGAIGEHALVSEHNRTDVGDDVARQLLEIVKLLVEDTRASSTETPTR